MYGKCPPNIPIVCGSINVRYSNLNVQDSTLKEMFVFILLLMSGLYSAVTAVPLHTTDNVI